MSRDLRVIHQSWGERFRAEFDPLREINEAVALYSVLEGAALRELVRLETEANGGTAAKVKCIHAAGAMRARRVEVLVAAGLMSATDLRPHSTLPRAAEIRAAIESAQFEPCDAPGGPQPTWRADDGDPLPLFSITDGGTDTATM